MRRSTTSTYRLGARTLGRCGPDRTAKVVFLSEHIHLTSVFGSFPARVVAARLAAEGIPTELRGLSECTYPLPFEVRIYVRADDEQAAREALLADAVDEVFSPAPVRAPRRSRSARRLRRREAT